MSPVKSTARSAGADVYPGPVRPSPRRPLVLALLGLAFGLAGTPRADAQDTALDRCVEDLSDAEIDARIAVVEGMFRRARPRARRWLWAWTAINGALAVGTASAAIAFRHEPLQRDSNILGSAGSAATLLLMFAPPLPAVYATERLEAMPMDDRAARIARLREGTRLLRATALQERVGTGPLNYVLAGGYAAFTGLYLGLRYAGEEGAVVNITLSVLGTVGIPMAQILSAPREAITDWDRYASGSLPCMAPALRPAPGPELSLAPAPGGVGLAVRF